MTAICTPATTTTPTLAALLAQGGHTEEDLEATLLTNSDARSVRQLMVWYEEVLTGEDRKVAISTAISITVWMVERSS